jgi:hypothetical protein
MCSTPLVVVGQMLDRCGSCVIGRCGSRDHGDSERSWQRGHSQRASDRALENISVDILGFERGVRAGVNLPHRAVSTNASKAAGSFTPNSSSNEAG